MTTPLHVLAGCDSIGFSRHRLNPQGTTDHKSTDHGSRITDHGLWGGGNGRMRRSNLSSSQSFQKGMMLFCGLPLICLLTFQLVKDIAVYEMGIALAGLYP